MKVFVSASILALAFSSGASAQDLCPCNFDTTDAADCRVYGQLGDDVLIPWYRASQDCLDAFNIKISAVQTSMLDGMCNPPNSNAFTNYLKFESTEASTSIKQSYGDFWDGDSMPVQLMPTINGVDCAANANGCWTEIKNYFETNPAEIEDNCQTFYNAAKKDLELEQSTVRIAVCNAEITADCGDLTAQVEEIKAAQPDKACSAFGLGPVTGGADPLPVCDDAAGGDSSREIDAGNSTGAEPLESDAPASTSSGVKQFASGLLVLPAVALWMMA